MLCKFFFCSCVHRFLPLAVYDVFTALSRTFLLCIYIYFFNNEDDMLIPCLCAYHSQNCSILLVSCMLGSLFFVCNKKDLSSHYFSKAPCVAVFFLLWTLLLSSSTRRRRYPSRLDGVPR